MLPTFEEDTASKGCPGPERLAAAALRGEELPHVRQCRECAEILGQFQGLEQALASLGSDVFDAPPPSGTTSVRSPFRLYAAAAVFAVAVLTGVAGYFEPVPMAQQTWRGATRKLTAQATASAAGGLELVWQPVEGAALYVVSLRDESGNELHQTEVAAGCSCVWTIPRPLDSPPATLLWTIDAIAPDSLRLATGAGELRAQADR